MLKNSTKRNYDERIGQTLRDPNEREDPIDIWQDLKDNLQVDTQNVLTSVLKVNYKLWMTNREK